MIPDSEVLHEIANTTDPSREADIVFVHGLSGGSHGTWRHGEEGNPGHFFWPEELGRDLPGCGVWTVGYPAGFTALGKPGMIIEKRAGNLSQKLANAGLGARPLLFITHSMGGLIVKSLIVGSQTLADPDRKRLVSFVRGVVFCATPHRGSAFADAAGVLGKLFGGSQDHVGEMRANAEPLDILHDQFIEWHRIHPIPVESYAENIGLFRTRWWRRPLPLGLVVPRASANPGIPGHTVRDVDDDHLTLVKPRDHQHDVYAGVRRFVRAALPAVSSGIVSMSPTIPTTLARESAGTSSIVKYAPAEVSRGSEAGSLVGNSGKALPCDVSRIGKYAPSVLIGRLDEMGLLSDAWDKAVRDEKKRPHVLTVVALGGEGKTSLVAKWAADLAHRDWPGCEAVYAWSFYHQGADEKTADSSDLFLKEALSFFGDVAMAGGAEHATDKARRLAQLVGERRALLILDGLEPLQYTLTSATPGELKDQGLATLLKALAALSRGLCVVTTRHSIGDLRAHWQTTAPQIELKRLPKEAGVALLRSFEVVGHQEEFERLVEDVKGHALTVNLLGTYLRDAHAGDIRKRDAIKLEEADAEEQGGHAFRVMDAYVQALETGGKTVEENLKGQRALALLQPLGLFDRPATCSCLDALWKEPVIPGLTDPLFTVEKFGQRQVYHPIDEVQRNIALKRLEEAKLITVNRDGSKRLVSLDSHPLLREYFARRVRQQQPEAWRAAHRRLYEHLYATTPDKPDATIEELQPLYQAVAHGCQAGLQREACDKVYRDRIQRGQEAYSTKKLGALGSDLGAVACFFETPWSRVSPTLLGAEEAWLLNEAAFTLRALGRLTEALEPMRAGVEGAVALKDWKSAARHAGNLSELELTLGELAGALRDAENSVTYADLSGDAAMRIVARALTADAWHQAGRRAEAEARFREAEQMQAEREPASPLLHSLPGFLYCDLQLTMAERGAWRTMLGSSRGEDVRSEDRSPVHADTNQVQGLLTPAATSVESSRAISQRGAKTLSWVEASRHALLYLGLERLTLGRAALYGSLLESRSRRSDSSQASQASLVGLSEEEQRAQTSEMMQLDAAVTSLRRAGQQQYLPLGLLTRAWLRSLNGTRTGPAGSQGDLDEAWEIAERGPMPLFMADIHLHRARLFFREATYPWAVDKAGNARGPKDDLAAARKLIEVCGYGRREEELNDVEGAAKSWPTAPSSIRIGKQTMYKTVIELDLKGYSDTVLELEENLSPEVVMRFNDQIQGFIDAGLKAAQLRRDDAVMATTGDGAILILGSPSIAHLCATAVHDACRVHNHEKAVASAKRWFRIGVATGDLAIATSDGAKKIAGSAIARAVRLETAGNIGEILVDTATYAGLSRQQKALYGPEEIIHGKRDEVFPAWRCVVVPGIGAAPATPRKTRPVAPTSSAALKRWEEKLAYLQEQLAIVSSAAQKFELKSQILEAKEMIEELGG